MALPGMAERLYTITPPTEEPVSLAEAKLHLKVEHPDDDAMISGFISSARILVEKEIKRALVTQTLEYRMACFPWSDLPSMERGAIGLATQAAWKIQLPRPPLQSIVSITYLDPSGSLQTLQPADYQADLGGEGPGSVLPAFGKVWPACRIYPDSVKVRYVAGFGSASAVPEVAKLGMKLCLTDWYLNRGATNVGNIVNTLPNGVASLLACLDWGCIG